MSFIHLPTRRLTQPFGPVEIDWSNPLTRGLLFALNPAAGERNLALPRQAIALSPFVLSSSTTGRLVGTGASEYEVTADLAKNLTLFAVWRSRESSQYLTADGARSVFSARNAGNAGWTWGRPANSNAAAGGATGNVAKQGFTLNGIADYEETNHTIESLVDSPVAVRYIKSTGTISWFNKGKKSSPDTAASTAGTNGGTLIFRRQGPFAANLLPWIDRTGASFVWNRGLSDSEIGQVSENPRQLYRPLQRLIWIDMGAAGGGAVTHAATGALSAAGASLSGTANQNEHHTSSGVLAGAGAALSGTAARTRQHDAIGDLIAAGAVLSGTADRTAAGGRPVTHTANGALTAGGAVLSGFAARAGTHTATGALAGAGAAISGAATRTAALVTHTATGALTGGGAALAGFAQTGELPVVNFTGADAWPEEKPRKREKPDRLIDDLLEAIEQVNPTRKQMVKAARVVRVAVAAAPASNPLSEAAFAAALEGTDVRVQEIVTEAVAGKRREERRRRQDDEIMLLI